MSTILRFVEIMANSISTKTSTLADGAFNELLTAIVKGEIGPGTKINEPLLSKQFGISRGPLREAIRRLEGCKLVQIRPNVGASVISLNRDQLIEIYEIRESLEGLSCQLAAEKASQQQCLQLRILLRQHEASIESAKGMLYYQQEGDLDFHYQLVRLSGNQRLFDLLCGELYQVMRLYRCQTSNNPSRPRQAFKEHHQIIDAIENQDGELASLLMRRHIAGAKATLLKNPDRERLNKEDDINDRKNNSRRKVS